MYSLVIGGNGFIGSHLVEELRQYSQVRVLSSGAPRADVDWSGIDYRRGNYAETEIIDSCLDGVDTVYHLVSTTVPSTSNIDPAADITGNLISTIGLLEQMRVRNVRRIVYFSSGGTVYGPPSRVPIDESHPTDPISSYGIVKLGIEKYLMMYSRLHGFSPLIIRPSNPYGPRQSGAGVQGVIAAFLNRWACKEPITVLGDGSVVRDYIYINDLVRLSATAGLGEVEGVFNAGSGHGSSINEIIELIAKTAGYSVPVQYTEARSFDVRKVVLDIDHAKAIFGWDPQVELAEGIRRTWEWWLGGRNGVRSDSCNS